MTMENVNTNESKTEKSTKGIEVEGFKKEIIKATNFKSLFDSLYGLGEVTGSNGKVYKASYLKAVINKIRKGEAVLSYITKTLGIRDKVAELVGKEKVISRSILNTENTIKPPVKDIKIEEESIVVIPENLGNGPRTKQQQQKMAEIRKSVLSDNKNLQNDKEIKDESQKTTKNIEVEDLSSDIEEIEVSGGVGTEDVKEKIPTDVEAKNLSGDIEEVEVSSGVNTEEVPRKSVEGIEVEDLSSDIEEIEVSGGVKAEDVKEKKSANVEEIEMTGGAETKFQRAIEKIDKKDSDKANRLLRTIGIEREKEILEQAKNTTKESGVDGGTSVEEKSDEKLIMDKDKDAFVLKYQDYLKTRRIRESLGISGKDKNLPEELQNLKSRYRDSKVAYMKSIYGAKRQELFDGMKDMRDVDDIDMEKAQEANRTMDEEYFSAKIFNEIELSQQEEIQKAKKEALGVKEQNLIMKGVEWYSKKSFVSKVSFSIAVVGGTVAGISLAGGATLVGASAVGLFSAGVYASNKIPRSIIGLFAGGLFGKIAGKIGEKTINKVDRSTKEEFSKGFNVKYLSRMEKLSQERVAKIENAKKRALWAKMLVSFSASMIAGRSALDLLHGIDVGVVHDALNEVGLSSGGVEPSLDQSPSVLESAHGGVHPDVVVSSDVVSKGGNIWSSAHEMVKDPKEFSEAWKNSMVHIPGQDASVHISEVSLVHSGTVVEYVKGDGVTAGHFEIIAPDGQSLPNIESQHSFSENMDIDKLSPDVLKIADGVMQDKISEIYKYKFLFFGGSQIDEWTGNSADGIVGIKDMKVSDILAGNFGDPFHGDMDAAQENNREQLLKFLNELRAEVNPVEGETTSEYVKRALAVQISVTEAGAKVMDVETLGSGADVGDLDNAFGKSITIDNIDVKSEVIDGVTKNHVVVRGGVHGYTGTEVLSSDYNDKLNVSSEDHFHTVEDLKDISRNLSLKLAAYDQLRSEGLEEKADILLNNIHEEVSMDDKRFGKGVIDYSKIPKLNK